MAHDLNSNDKSNLYFIIIIQRIKIAENRVLILEAFCLTLFKRIRQK